MNNIYRLNFNESDVKLKRILNSIKTLSDLSIFIIIKSHTRNQLFMSTTDVYPRAPATAIDIFHVINIRSTHSQLISCPAQIYIQKRRYRHTPLLIHGHIHIQLYDRSITYTHAHSSAGEISICISIYWLYLLGHYSCRRPLNYRARFDCVLRARVRWEKEKERGREILCGGGRKR